MSGKLWRVWDTDPEKSKNEGDWYNFDEKDYPEALPMTHREMAHKAAWEDPWNIFKEDDGTNTLWVRSPEGVIKSFPIRMAQTTTFYLLNEQGVDIEKIGEHDGI